MNNLTNSEIIKPWLNIGCNNLKCNSLQSSINNNGSNGDILYTNGTDIYWDINEGKSYGEISFQDNLNLTPFLMTDTYYKIVGTMSADNINNFLLDNDELKYTGLETRLFNVSCSLSSQMPTSPVIVKFALTKNGSIQIESSIASISVDSAYVPFTTSSIISLSTNDSIGLYVSNLINTDSILIAYCHLQAVPI